MTDRKITVTAEEALEAVNIVYDISSQVFASGSKMSTMIVLDPFIANRIRDWHFTFIAGKSDAQP